MCVALNRLVLTCRVNTLEDHLDRSGRSLSEFIS
jgi:hypothetical protein